MIPTLEQYQGLNVTFNVTEECNLRCRYCYELDKRPGDLPLDYAKRFADLLISDPDPIGAAQTGNEWMLRNGLVMDLIGGDALMRPELCRSILRYWTWASTGHRWGTRWRASIATNGTLFGDPMVKEFLEEFASNISLGISIDGCPTIHNLNRSNSMPEIMKHWQWYMDFAGKTASTKSTCNRESIPYLLESLRFMHEELGLRHINQNFVFEDLSLTEEDYAELDQQLGACVEYCELHRDDLYFGLLAPDTMAKEGQGVIDKGWCGAGSMPALAITGKIYPCFRFLPHTMSDRGLDFHVGDIWNGFDHKERFLEVRAQTREKISPEECRTCSVESSCAWCIGGAYSECGRFYRQTNICRIHKLQAKWSKEVTPWIRN